MHNCEEEECLSEKYVIALKKKIVQLIQQESHIDMKNRAELMIKNRSCKAAMNLPIDNVFVLMECLASYMHAVSKSFDKHRDIDGELVKDELSNCLIQAINTIAEENNLTILAMKAK